MKPTFLFAILFFLAGTLLAQQDEPSEEFKLPKLEKDPETKAFLDKLSAKNRNQNMRVKFQMVLEDKRNQKNEKKEGIVYLKGDKYKLFIYGSKTEVIFDGKTMISYIRTFQDGEVFEEVTYTNPDPADRNSITPANIFSFYEEGYYYKIVADIEQDGRKLKVIDFIPENRDNATVSRIRLKVDTQKNQIYTVKSLGKSGQDFLIKLTEIKTGVTIPESLFTFDESQHPNIIVNDMR